MGRKRVKAVYQATNTIENKHYIGQTTFTLANRKAGHKTKALKLNSKSPFYDAIREYGWEAFEWSIVCECETQEELDRMEDQTIVNLGRENCYNSHTGGTRHFNLSDELKQDISERMKGENNHQYGLRRTPEELKTLLAASMEVCQKQVQNIETGDTYPSVSECARREGYSIANISLHCNGKVKTPRYRFL